MAVSVRIYVRNAENVGLPNRTVKVRARGATASDVVLKNGGSAVVEEAIKHSDSNGLTTFTLDRNSDLLPTTSYYKAIIPTETRSRSVLFRVPTIGAGPFDLEDIAVEEPGAVPSTALELHAADPDAHGVISVNEADAIRFVSANGDDDLGGRSLGEPKATIQAALDALPDGAGGEVLVLSPLTVMTETTIEQSGVTVRGAGQQTLTWGGSVGVDMLSVGYSLERITISDLRLLASGKAINIPGSASNAAPYGCMYMTLRNIEAFSATDDAIYIRNSYWNLLDSVIASSTGGHSMHFDGFDFDAACNMTTMIRCRFAGEGSGSDSLRIKWGTGYTLIAPDFSGNNTAGAFIRLQGVRNFRVMNSWWETTAMTGADAYPVILERVGGTPCTDVEFDGNTESATSNIPGDFCYLDGAGHIIEFSHWRFTHSKVGGGTAKLVRLNGASGITLTHWPFGDTPFVSYVNDQGLYGTTGFTAIGGATQAVGAGTIANPNFSGTLDMRGATRVVLKNYTTATRPTASAVDGQQIYVSDAADANRIQFAWDSAWHNSAGTVVA